MVSFKRQLQLDKYATSAFLFGPRMTGKTYLLRQLAPQKYVDLLDPEIELQLRQTPKFFWEQLQTLKKDSLVIVDEVQRVPVLLDYVQKAIEELGLRFILSGSSARKLRRGGINLLGGRAADLRLHPLTLEEAGSKYSLAQCLHYGSLPKVVSLVLSGDLADAKRILRSYATTYIKEEIQAEALTRNVGAFQRFLHVAVQGNGQVLEFSNISRECSVPMSTVKEYYSILEDTLLGQFLWPWDRSERKKARPKFYFFDCGVVRALQNRLDDPATSEENGIFFENFFFREMVKYRDYLEKPHEFSFWREGDHEVDLLISDGRGIRLGIECKSGKVMPSESTIRNFRKRFPKVPLWVASMRDQEPRLLKDGVEVLPWAEVLKRYRYPGCRVQKVLDDGNELV